MTHDEKIKFILNNYNNMTAEQIADKVLLHRNSVQRIAWRNGVNKKIIATTLDGEKWFELEGFSRYLISNKSRIKRKRDNAIISTTLTEDYYHSIKLVNDNNSRITTRLHRLVAITFIPNDENKPEVNHIDCDKNNNLPENLEWVTGGENQIHSYANNLRQPANVNYEKELVISVCELIEKGLENVEIVKQINNKMNRQQVNRIRTKVTWKSISDNYDF